jgi:hypothetical protein
MSTDWNYHQIYAKLTYYRYKFIYHFHQLLLPHQKFRQMYHFNTVKAQSKADNLIDNLIRNKRKMCKKSQK